MILLMTAVPSVWTDTTDIAVKNDIIKDHVPYSVDSLDNIIKDRSEVPLVWPLTMILQSQIYY